MSRMKRGSLLRILMSLTLAFGPVLGPTRAFAATSEEDAEEEVEDVSVKDLGFCEMKISQLSGVWGAVCREVISSPEGRVACSKIKKEDRIKCDGSEDEFIKPSKTEGVKAFDKDMIVACLPKLVDGVKAGVKEYGEYAWETTKSAYEAGKAKAELAYAGAKRAGGRVVNWFLGEGTAKAVPTKTASTESSGKKIIDPSASSGVMLSDSTTGAVANTVVDEEQQIDWLALMTNKDFWLVMFEETKSWLYSESMGFLCMKPQLQNDAVCELLGDVVVLGGLMKAGSAALKKGLKPAGTAFKSFLSKNGKKVLSRVRAPAAAKKAIRK